MERLNKSNNLRGMHRTPANVPRYEQRKRQRNLRVTDVGWNGLNQVAKSQGLSLAELIEQIGRGKIRVEPVEGSAA